MLRVEKVEKGRGDGVRPTVDAVLAEVDRKSVEMKGSDRPVGDEKSVPLWISSLFVGEVDEGEGSCAMEG